MAFPGTYNISYYRGDTFTILVTPKASNGSTFDLSSYSGAGYIATKRGDDQTIILNPGVTIDSNAGTITFTITPAEGEVLNASTAYFYDIEIYTAGRADVLTVLTGTLTVTDDVRGTVA